MCEEMFRETRVKHDHDQVRCAYVGLETSHDTIPPLYRLLMRPSKTPKAMPIVQRL